MRGDAAYWRRSSSSGGWDEFGKRLCIGRSMDEVVIMTDDQGQHDNGTDLFLGYAGTIAGDRHEQIAAPNWFRAITEALEAAEVVGREPGKSGGNSSLC